MFTPQQYDYNGRPDQSQPGRGIDLSGRGGLIGGLVGGMLGPAGGLVGRGIGTAIDVNAANQDISRAGGVPNASWGSAMANGLSFGALGQSANAARDIGVQSGNEGNALSQMDGGSSEGPGTSGYGGYDVGFDSGDYGWSEGGDVNQLLGPDPAGPDDGWGKLRIGETVIDPQTSAMAGGHDGIMRLLAQALAK
jgi:hypothetical protein